MISKDTSFIIAGAGIGGLTMGLCLHQHGYKVDIYERAPQITELGLGIQISPSATKVLIDLGLENELVQKGTLMERYDKFKSSDGSIIRQRKVGVYGGFDHNQYGFHRGELQMILYHHAIKVIGQDHIHVNSEASGFEQKDGKVTLKFNDGKSVTADALIACDGIRSAIRKQMYPDEQARFTGWVIYRGAPKVEEVTIYKPVNIAKTFGNSSSYFAYYPIKGNSLVSWGACMKVETGPTLESWGAKADKSHVESWRSWNEEVKELIDRSSDIFKFEIYDRDPISKWSEGNVTLLGDAAHPMLPFLGQGATSAITDSETLVNELLKANSIEEAFKSYESQRIPFTAQLVEINRNRGGVFEEFLIVEQLGHVPDEWPNSYARKLY